LRDLSVVER